MHTNVIIGLLVLIPLLAGIVVYTQPVVAPSVVETTEPVFIPGTPETSRATYSDGMSEVEAVFDNRAETVTFTHDATGEVVLPRAVSGSGARYASEDERLVFWEHQGEATIEQDGETIFLGALVENRPTPSTSPDPTSPTTPPLGSWIWEGTYIVEPTLADGEMLVMEDILTDSPGKPTAFTLTFTADGRLSGTTDCNGFGGSYTTDGDGDFSLGELASTKMFCEDSQETDFTAALSTADRYAQPTPDGLILHLSLSGEEMRFVRK